MVWIIVGVLVIAIFIGGVFSVLASTTKVVTLGVSSFLIRLFGRKGSPMAKLHEPPELALQPWPAPKNDRIVQALSEWEPPPLRAFRPSWPMWQSLWIEETEGSDAATASEIESLFTNASPPPLPYEKIDRPPIFVSGNIDCQQEERPSEPTYVRENYSKPVLSLPFWKPPFEFFNVFVEAAHGDIIAQFRQLQARRLELETTARKLNKARSEAWMKVCDRSEKAMTQFREYHGFYVEQREAARIVFEKARDADLEPLLQTRALIETKHPEGVVRHFDLTLRQLVLPAFVPRQWMISFEQETKTLLVEHRFPEIARLEIVKDIQQTHLSAARHVSLKLRKTVLPKIQPALCLRIARVLAEADTFNFVEAIAVNGWVDFFERATGKPRRAYCASLIAKKDALLALRLETADPIAAFNSLRGASAGEAYETIPLMPSLKLQTDDPRFIEPRETTEKIAKGENLAAMDWEDFEHLVRELFEREFAANGAEVKITRASRDQGVDAVIFDPDPLRGGKIVIQAKRYTLPVDVSAVRDLYGTVMNEGANSGILVTTSHYGPEAYAFVQNKPLKLINGAQLLGLLEKAGYRFRIDLAEARALSAK